jgi:Domain of Unknown Function (DUF1080)
LPNMAARARDQHAGRSTRPEARGLPISERPAHNAAGLQGGDANAPRAPGDRGTEQDQQSDAHQSAATGTEEEIAMKRLSVIVMGLLISGSTVVGCAQLSGSDAGWITLIDGASGLDNWDRVGDANWRAEGGAIVADAGKGGFLVSKNSYKDFQIRAEFWADHTTNSGIYMRCADPKVITDKSCYEANIFDQRPDPTFGTGAVVHIAPVSPPMQLTGGKWNTFEITAKGSQLIVVLNGVQTAKVEHNQFAQGPIALQYGTLPPKGAPGGAIKWRKVQIKLI